MIECRNPACKCTLFTVEIEYKKQSINVKSGNLNVPVQLICSKCGQKQHAYVMNNQLKEIMKTISQMDRKVTELIDYMDGLVSSSKKPNKWWEFWKRTNK